MVKLIFVQGHVIFAFGFSCVLGEGADVTRVQSKSSDQLELVTCDFSCV